MDAAQRALVNQVCDKLVEILSTINKNTDATRWQSAPKTVRAGMFVGDVQWPLPALMVEFANWTDNRAYAGPHHQADMIFNVHCIVNSDDPTQAQDECVSLATDVVRALSRDRQLEGFVLWADATNFGINRSIIESIGKAASSVTVEIAKPWVDGQP